MSHDQADVRWDVRRSREIAHLEAPGVIDLRITRAGRARVRDDFGHDAAVRRDPSRRDWIELHLLTGFATIAA